MRLLADENVDRPIARWLTEQGHDVLEVAAQAPGAPDQSVILLSRQTNRVLLTFDRDIGRLLLADIRPHPGVVYLRLTGVADELWERFKIVWPTVETIAPNHFVTVQNNRIRHRPLPMQSPSQDNRPNTDQGR
jgi:predicted nuclease of predicted toxin-antitoxin system